MTDRSWPQRVVGSLQLALSAGGATMVVLGLVAAVVVSAGLGVESALAIACPAYVAAVVHAVRWGRAEPSVGFTPTLSRTMATAALSAGLALAAAAAVTATLGTVTRPTGALALAAVGVVATLLGRIGARSEDDEAPLVSTRQWAAGDDATAVAAMILLTIGATITADPVRQALAVAGALGPLSAGGRLALLALGVGVPLATLATLARTPPGRSPVARGLLVAALAPVGGLLLMLLFGGPAAEQPQALEPSIGAAAAAWRRAQALGGCAALAGAMSAALVALTAALRARAHGVVVDDHGRRTSTLLAALASGCVVLLTAALLLGKVGLARLPPLGVATGLTGAIGVVAIHLGAGSLGATPSPMRQRAGGYIASATIAAALAVVEAAAAIALFASLGRPEPATTLLWPGAMPAAVLEQHVHGALALASLVPMGVAAGLTLRERGGLRCFAIAGRHLDWALLAASLSLLGILAQVPPLRAAVSAPLDQLAATVQTPAMVSAGPLCRRLDADGLLRLDAKGLAWGSSAPLALDELGDAAALDQALTAVDAKVVTVASDAELPALRLTTVLAGLSRAGRCEVRLLALDRQSGLPRCTAGRLSGPDCPSAPSDEVVRIAPGRVQVDRGAPGGGVPGVARLRGGVFPDDRFLWSDLGRDDLGLWVAPDTRVQDAVWMWHELGRLTRKGELSYLLAASVDEEPKDDEGELELALTAADPATAIALEPHFGRRRGRLLACSSKQPASVYRLALRDNGQLAAVIPAEGASWSGAGCVRRQLGDLALPLRRATMVVLSLYRR